MQIKKYGVELNRMTVSDLEMVRQWRNATHVRTAMEYQNHIDEQMQETWYNTLDAERDYYFIISQGSEKAGVVNLKNADGVEAEAGIFIGEKKFLNTLVPVAATLVVMEFAFDELGLEKLKAKIAQNNLRAIRFNEALGYKIRGDESGKFVYYSVTKPGFYEATHKFRDVLR